MARTAPTDEGALPQSSLAAGISRLSRCFYNSYC